MGNLTTGEASAPVVTPVLGLEEGREGLYSLSVHLLCLVNLVDAAAGPPRAEESLAPPGLVTQYLGKLRLILDAISASKGATQAEVRQALLATAQTATQAVQRVASLAAESGFSCRAPDIADALTMVPVGDAITFCRGLATIAKLDYARRFLQALAKHCCGKGSPYKEAGWQATALVNMLYRMVRRYRGFIETANAEGGLIGIEWEKLEPPRDGKPDGDRRGTQEMTQDIIRLFTTDLLRALVAIEDKTSAYPFA